MRDLKGHPRKGAPRHAKVAARRERKAGRVQLLAEGRVERRRDDDIGLAKQSANDSAQVTTSRTRLTHNGGAPEHGRVDDIIEHGRDAACVDEREACKEAATTGHARVSSNALLWLGLVRQLIDQLAEEAAAAPEAWARRRV